MKSRPAAKPAATMILLLVLLLCGVHHAEAKTSKQPTVAPTQEPAEFTYVNETIDFVNVPATPEATLESTLPPAQMPLAEADPIYPSSDWYDMALYNDCWDGAINVSVLFFNESDNLVCIADLLLQYKEGGFINARTQRPYFFTYAESVSGQHIWDGSELDVWDGSGELPDGATVMQNCGTDELVKMIVVTRVVNQNVLLMEFNCTDAD